MDKNFTEKELQFLNELKIEFIKKHKDCKGIGYKKDVSDVCECMKIFKYIMELVYSKIPSDYWELSLDELKIEGHVKKIAKEFIDNLKNAVDNGLGIIFLGNKGIGKTSLMCEIGKQGLIKRYNVYYQIAQNIVDDRFTQEHDVLNRIKEADILLLDELDKVIMRKESNIPKQLENFLRDILPNKKTIIMGTNASESELDNMFGIMSLLKRYIKLIPFEGEDFSDEKQKAWMDKLKNQNINYFNKNIVLMAGQFHLNQNVADEKELSRIIKDVKEVL